MPAVSFRVKANIETGLVLLLIFVISGCSPKAEPSSDLIQEMTLASSYLNSFNFDDALELYEDLSANLREDNPYWAEITYGYAVALWNVSPPSESNVIQAVRLFEEIKEHWPESRWARSAQLSIARSHMIVDYIGDEPDIGKAQSILEQLIYPSVDFISHEAALRYAETYLMSSEIRENSEDAIEFLEGWVQAYPKGPLSAVMLELLGEYYWIQLNDEERALAAFIRSVSYEQLDTNAKGIAFWRIGNLAEKQGENGIAIEFYSRIVKEVPFSGRSYEAIQRIEFIKASDETYSDFPVPARTPFLN